MKPKPKKKPSPTDTPTTPAEEWGDRFETGRQIARSGQDEGCVPEVTGHDIYDPRSGGGHCNPPDVGVPDGMPER